MVDFIDANNMKEQLAPNQVGGKTKPEMSEYQKQLLEEINKQPKLIKLFTAIFNDYPKLIRKEFVQTEASQSRRQKEDGLKTRRVRLSIEAFIEEQICMLAGISIKEDSKLEQEAGKEN